MANTVATYREIVQQLLNSYAQIPYAYGKLTEETIFDREADRYLLLTMGWQGHKWVHTPTIHIDLLDHKMWVQCNNTDQDIVEELVEKGVARKDIVVASIPPQIREQMQLG